MMKKAQKNSGKNSKNRYLLIIILVFAFISLLFSLLIEYQNFKESKVLNDICAATGSSCNSVQNSEFGRILGIKVAHIGVVAFSIFLIVVLLQIFRPRKWTKLIMLTGAGVASSMGVYFIYTQAFVLHHYCVYCLIIDSSSVLILIFSLIYFYKEESVVKIQKAL